MSLPRTTPYTVSVKDSHNTTHRACLRTCWAPLLKNFSTFNFQKTDVSGFSVPKDLFLLISKPGKKPTNHMWKIALIKTTMMTIKICCISDPPRNKYVKTVHRCYVPFNQLAFTNRLSYKSYQKRP